MGVGGKDVQEEVGGVEQGKAVVRMCSKKGRISFFLKEDK